MIRLDFEPKTSCVAGGYSYHLAIDVNCYRKLNKQYVREIRDSTERTELERFCQAPSLMAAPRRSCSSFDGEVKQGEILIGYYVMKLLNRV